MPIYKMKGSKGGKQKYRVRINYQDSSGENRQIDRVAYGISDAKELESKLLRDVKEEVPAKRMTLNDLYEEFVRIRSHEVRESTMVRYKRVLNNHILPELGKVQLSKLNKPTLNQWKNHIDEKVITKNDGTTKKLNITSKQKIYNVFRTLLNYGVKMDYMPKNILCELGNFKETLTVKKEMDFYTAEEFKRYKAAALEYAQNRSDLSGWDYYVFFCIAFYTGLRKGEIHALKWSDIDGNLLHVTRSIDQKQKGGDRETAPKSKSSIRTLQIPKPLLDILSEHKRRWSEINGFSDDYRICGGTRPIRDTSLANANERFAKLAGLNTIRIHDFRHSHASLLANEGINIQEVARRLGHSDVTMTWNTYSHLYPREEERAVNILNKIV